MRISIKRILIFLCSAFLFLKPAGAQSDRYTAYIEQYKHMAMEQMFKYGVPASITLAQGLLESAAGRSQLAVKANNHFGIKVSGSWTGPYVLYDDDAANEKFRKYRSVAESYEDHSRFLCTNRRYAGLFKLERSDYKGWAHGLKAAGYATNPRYAGQLVSLIERYKLHRYDKISRRNWEDGDRAEAADVASTGTSRRIYRCNGSYYVIAREGDTYESLGKWAGVRRRKLEKYNEVPSRAVLRAGDVVYLEKKRSKADRKLKGHVHRVQAGESMHSISQHYGMRLEALYKLNKLPDYALPSVGDVLRIR